MAGLAIYTRVKVSGKGWRYKRIEESRGVKTGSLKGPFYLRPTQNGGAQPWVKLDADNFDQAKAERDRKKQGERLLAENTVGRIAIENAIVDFLDLKKRRNPSTVRNYTHILNEFLDQTSARYVDQVDRKVFDSYITWLESENEAAPKTIRNKVMVIVFMLKEAGITQPFKMVRDLLPTIEEDPAEPYDTKELGKLFSKMDDEELVRYTFFLVSGAREKEVAHAKWTDLSTKVSVPHFIVQAKKFKYADGTSGEFTPKTHERREVPLTKELADMLAARKKASQSDWIFPNEMGDPEGHFLRKFKKIAFRAGMNCGKCVTTRSEGRYTKTKVEKSCRTFGEGCDKHYLHRLRKSRATFWHTHGVPLRTIQHWLGHKSLETTQKYLGVESAVVVQDKINKPMF